MRGLRTFCLVAMLAVAQVALARAEGPRAATFTTLSCAMPFVASELGPRVQCTPVSDTVLPAGGVAIRRQESGLRIGTRRTASFAIVQMNLCNSGIAGCFTGRAATRAVQTVLGRVPALVTVNEACESDVTDRLLPAMLALYPNEWLFWTFAPAAHRGTDQPVRCTPDARGKDRGRFGNGALGRLFTDARPRFSFDGGLFPDDRRSPDELQDREHAELRSWVCADAGHIYRACTTHLDNPSATGAGTPEQARVASNQCRHLTGSVDPAGGPTVLLGDLNLGADPAAKYSVQGCAPEGWSHDGDGSVQHALASNEFGAAAVEVLPMGDTTDHPALVVVYRPSFSQVWPTNDGRGAAAQEGRYSPLRPFIEGGDYASVERRQASRQRITLDWSRSEHWSQSQQACRICGHLTQLVDFDGLPCHKVCAEAVINGLNPWSW